MGETDQETNSYKTRRLEVEADIKSSRDTKGRTTIFVEVVGMAWGLWSVKTSAAERR